MTKVTINPTSEQVQGNMSGDGSMVVFDAKGRSIKIAEPDFLSQFRLTEAVGKSADNAQYMNMVRPLLYVREIDGDHVFAPNTKVEVEALIKRLGAEGYNALANALVEKFTNEDDGQSVEDKLKK